MKNTMILFLLITSIAFGKPRVMTTIFPVYDGVREIGGDRVEVDMLIKPGSDPHSFDLSPRDIARVEKSDALIYLSEGMEVWIDRVTSGVGSLKSYELVHLEPHNHSHGHDHSDDDPHIWLDPIEYIDVLERVKDILIETDLDGRGYYTDRYIAYKSQLEELDRDIKETISKSRYDTIIYAGHYAFGRFSNRYGLKYITPYKNTSPNGNITPRALKNLIDAIEASGQRYIYKESLVNSKISRVLEDEVGVKTLELHQMGSISKSELEEEKTYLIIMRENLENLKKGLEYGN